MNLKNAVKRCALAGEQARKNVASLAADSLSKSLVVAAIGLAAATSSHAVGFTLDATDIIAVITAGVTTISSIGIAVLSLVVVVKLFKWVQRVL